MPEHYGHNNYLLIFNVICQFVYAQAVLYRIVFSFSFVIKLKHDWVII